MSFDQVSITERHRIDNKFDGCWRSLPPAAHCGRWPISTIPDGLCWTGPESPIIGQQCLTTAPVISQEAARIAADDEHYNQDKDTEGGVIAAGGSVVGAGGLPQPGVGARREVRVAAGAAVVADVCVGAGWHVVRDAQSWRRALTWKSRIDQLRVATGNFYIKRFL